MAVKFENSTLFYGTQNDTCFLEFCLNLVTNNATRRYKRKTRTAKRALLKTIR